MNKHWAFKLQVGADSELAKGRVASRVICWLQATRNGPEADIYHHRNPDRSLLGPITPPRHRPSQASPPAAPFYSTHPTPIPTPTHKFVSPPIRLVSVPIMLEHFLILFEESFMTESAVCGMVCTYESHLVCIYNFRLASLCTDRHVLG